MRHLIPLLLLIIPANLLAQQEHESSRKNIIKLDLTSHLWYKNAIVLAYERVTKPNQSFVVTAGFQQFQPFTRFGQNILVTSEANSSGFRVGGDYRFYLKKENKYLAPRGVYVGPYFTYHTFSNDHNIEVNNNGTPENGSIAMDLNVGNIGVQLGYQFVLNNRWTIDLVFIGPSVSHYEAKIGIDGNFTIVPDEIAGQLIDALIDRFPGFKELVETGEVTSNGKMDTWAYGYRYQIQVGYHFGRGGNKKK
ncbi:MAG: DUF3575 domain-containing protein [Cyclobacteriaceae bacterium]|nr:DUF3575 domain-containing protein [Cyclobacteriaceae bacterium]